MRKKKEIVFILIVTLSLLGCSQSKKNIPVHSSEFKQKEEFKKDRFKECRNHCAIYEKK